MPSDFVTRELLFALAGSVTAALLLRTAADPAAGWPVGLGAAIVAATTLGVADNLGRRPAFGLVGLVGATAVGLVLFTYPPEVASVAAGMIGMNVGWALERVVFGLVRPVPEPRLARERA